jgi:3-isopropylmalate/(R)-2-methylmalate dehydratase small subunit
MKKFTSHRGVAVPLIHNNIDTDSIIPSVEMKRVSKRGLSVGLFAGWRYTDREDRVPNPEFALNLPRYQGASILLTGRNFGCGSSREHAVWALAEYGIRAVVAPSFGAIFHANCIANGLLPIELDTAAITGLADHTGRDPQRNRLVIDLRQRSIRAAAGLEYRFEMAESDAEMLLNGWDPVALTLRLEHRIDEFQRRDRKQRPWAYL